MKVAILYNRDSKAVFHTLGKQNREKYDLETIQRITQALSESGHEVESFEGDRYIIDRLDSFFSDLDQKDRKGIVFNLSYGIQGNSRYTHIPAMLEMLGLPYVGSGPESHALALNKVLTKIVLMHRGLPTPLFRVFEVGEHPLQPEVDPLAYPRIVKPKDEAVSFGLRKVHDFQELAHAVAAIHQTFQTAALVEEYVEGREINVGLLGNDPVTVLPPCEIHFDAGEAIYTYEDKKGLSGRSIKKEAPARLGDVESRRIRELSLEAFQALGCRDAARVDFRLNDKGEPSILEVNSLPSLTATGSYVYAAEKMGLDYAALVNRLVEEAWARYFPGSHG